MLVKIYSIRLSGQSADGRQYEGWRLIRVWFFESIVKLLNKELNKLEQSGHKNLMLESIERIP